MAKRLAAMVAVVLSLGLGSAACGDGSGSGSASVSGTGSGSGAGGETEALAFPEDEADTVGKVTLKAYEFGGIPASILGPKVFFEATNENEHDHELEILDADGKAVDEIAAFSGDDEKQLAVELEPGTYTAQCILKEGAKTHADLGMTQRFTVTA
jgi:hypothetical protein